MNPRRIEILGAGLSGSLLAILLARRGLAVTLHERQADPRQSDAPAGRSINLALAARGIRALQHAGVFEPVRELLIPMRGRMIHRPDGSTELQPYGLRDEECIHSVSRAGLNRILLDCAEREHAVTPKFGQTAEAYDPESCAVTFRDARSGSRYTREIRPLIAADGAGSVIRRAYGTGSRIAPREELLGHGYKELTLPAGPDGNFQLDPEALHIWPRGGFMLIALPNPGGDFTLTLFLPKHGDPSFRTLQTAAQVERFFAAEFADVLPLLPHLGDEFAGNPTGLLGTVRCRHWNDHRLLLIGDAAHAIVPFHGQGMNLAFEDCRLLDGLLEKGDDWSVLFAEFEALQRPNAEAIADMALDNYVEMRDRVRDPQFALLKELAFELERRLPGHFIPRYSMVMFHDEIPYAVARERGAQQQELLRRIAGDATRLAEIDLEAAQRAARETLPPLEQNGVEQRRCNR